MSRSFSVSAKFYHRLTEAAAARGMTRSELIDRAFCLPTAAERGARRVGQPCLGNREFLAEIRALIGRVSLGSLSPNVMLELIKRGDQ